MCMCEYIQWPSAQPATVPDNDSMIQWLNHAMIQWFSDSMIQWLNDSMTQGFNDSMIQGARDPGSQGARATKLQTLGLSGLGAVRGTLPKIIHGAFCNWMSKIWDSPKTHARKKRVIQGHPTASRPVPTIFFQRSKISLIQWP